MLQCMQGKSKYVFVLHMKIWSKIHKKYDTLTKLQKHINKKNEYEIHLSLGITLGIYNFGLHQKNEKCAYGM